MATSGTISSTVFNTNKVIDTAFRRCRLKAEQVTPEMQSYARDALYMLLSDLGNIGTPAWCIEQIILPIYQAQPKVTLPIGTVGVLNANFRYQNTLTGSVSTTSTSYTTNFGSQASVNTVGVLWSGNSVDLDFQVSSDNLTWNTVGTQTTTAVAGELTWTDISRPLPYQYFRVTSLSAINYVAITLQNNPAEIPMGVLNRDNYVNQTNKVFPGRPTQYWFQRDLVRPVMHLWPAPSLQSQDSQLVIWRHRHVMDVGELRQDIEIPQRWYDAIVDDLAFKMCISTPEVDKDLIPMNEQRAATSMARAWAGDADGSSTFIQPWITPYTM
jgi:hypothetical protein